MLLTYQICIWIVVVIWVIGIALILYHNMVPFYVMPLVNV